MRRLPRILLNAATGLFLATSPPGCSPPSEDPPSVVLSESFLAELNGSLTVEFDLDPKELALMSDAEFERLLASDRSAGTFLGTSPAAVDAAIERLRHRRAVARSAPSGLVVNGRSPSK